MAFAQKPFESFRPCTPWAGSVACSITALSMLCRVQSILIIECHISEYITLSFFAELGIRKNEIRENLVCDLPRACVNQALTGREAQFRVSLESRYKTKVPLWHGYFLSSALKGHVTPACLKFRTCALIQATNPARKLSVIYSDIWSNMTLCNQSRCGSIV
jgi:hypothetical protein